MSSAVDLYVVQSFNAIFWYLSFKGTSKMYLLCSLLIEVVNCLFVEHFDSDFVLVKGQH
jgi:hypothetical protein